MEVNQSKDLILLKILLLGSSGSGKTHIFNRYFDRNPEYIITTIGVSSKTKIIQFDKYKIELQIYDTIGTRRFRDIARNYYKSNDGMIFVCDITDYSSYEDMINFVEEANYLNVHYFGIICANKCDLEIERKVTKEEIVSYGLSQNMEVFETSAKTGKNINEAFHRLIELIIRKREKDIEILENMNNKKLLDIFRIFNKF